MHIVIVDIFAHHATSLAVVAKTFALCIPKKKRQRQTTTTNNNDKQQHQQQLGLTVVGAKRENTGGRQLSKGNETVATG